MTEAMIGLAVVLAGVGVLMLLAIDLAAFGESMGQGLVSLFVPPYALYYAWSRLHRRLLATGVVLVFLAAGAAGLFSDAFAPRMEIPNAEGFESIEAPLNE